MNQKVKGLIQSGCPWLRSAEAALVPVEVVTTTPRSSNEPVTVPEVPSVQHPENLGQTRRRKIVILPRPTHCEVGMLLQPLRTECVLY